MHPDSTQRDEETNAFIQAETIALYEVLHEPNARVWGARTICSSST